MFNFKRPKWIPRWVNAPFIIISVFILWLFFFGDNNFAKIHAIKSEINDIKAEIKANQDSAEMFDAKVNELHTDRETLEKIAREKYGMKRENEEVFITDIP
ncbi:MAG: septum formation initiator family protein [Bacteroidales bacterium]|nr:septum formation initiator family protein [Candidatus Sodaliphilus aphodohippi]